MGAAAQSRTSPHLPPVNALRAHPAGALLFSDLLRLPELFPFDLADLRAAHLTRSGWFEIGREGGWDMVRLRYETAG